MKLKKLIFVIAVSIIVILTCASTVNAKTAVVDVEALNLREEASSDGDVIRSLDEGNMLEVLEENEEWTKVKADEDIGYVKTEFIKIEEEQETKPVENKEAKTENTTKLETTTTTTETKNFKIRYAKIKEDVNIYILPLINANKISQAKKDSEVIVMDETNKWLYIQTDKVNGWILKSAVEEIEKLEQEVKETTNQNKEETKPEENVAENKTAETKVDEKTSDTKLDERIMYINTESANVRSGPGTDYEAVDSFVLNNSVTVIAENGEWYKVRLEDEGTGYIAKRLLSDEREPSTSREAGERKVQQVEETTRQSDISKGQEIVNFAEQYLGCPYVYGGSGPDTFDCSGFTMYVYENFGISLSHSAIAQSNVGTYVSKEDLQPGDLVFFLEYETMDEIGHVGIYIGDGNFIHASSGTGYCVKISTLLSGSYNTRYETARRIF